jgi:PilZ domain
MSQGLLRKFMPRAPRYTLRPSDKHAMRFALETTRGPGGIESTLMYNISESGLAFIVDAPSPIQIGEAVKVEFPIPGGEQIAWWGRVVRIEEYSPRQWSFSQDPFGDHKKLMVALRFEDLPEPHRRHIQKGVQESFLRAMKEQQFRTWHYYRILFLHNAYRWFVSAVVIAFLVGMVVYMLIPNHKDGIQMTGFPEKK